MGYSEVTDVNRRLRSEPRAKLRLRTYGAKAGALSRLRTANSMTALTCSRLRPSYHSVMPSRLAPASRFSKMADTGIRVPFNTHAPLTLPGTLSTAGHCDQSRFAMGEDSCSKHSFSSLW